MPDGATLRGQSFPAGRDWALMLHDIDQDLDSWHPLIGTFIAAGFSVALLDMRGHGASDGEPDEEAVLGDIRPMLSQIRKDVEGTLLLVSAGKVGASVLDESLHSCADAVVLFSPATQRPAVELRGEGMPKLFFVGGLDRERDRLARDLRNSSLGHAGVVSFPTREQGTDLLREPWRSHVLDHVRGFARGVASVEPTTNSTGGRA